MTKINYAEMHVSRVIACNNLPSKFQCQDKHWSASQNQRSMASASEMIRPFEPAQQRNYSLTKQKLLMRF